MVDFSFGQVIQVLHSIHQMKVLYKEVGTLAQALLSSKKKMAQALSILKIHS